MEALGGKAPRLLRVRHGAPADVRIAADAGRREREHVEPWQRSLGREVSRRTPPASSQTGSPAVS